MKEISLILKELRKASGKIKSVEVKRLVDGIIHAKKIYVEGKGRSGYMAASFNMRLKHLGLKLTNKPGKNDLAIIISGSGRTKETLRKVKKLKGKTKIFCITMDKNSPVARQSDFVVMIQAKKSRQPLRSLFEQETLLLLDAIIIKLMKNLKISEKEMWRRHD